MPGRESYTVKFVLARSTLVGTDNDKTATSVRNRQSAIASESCDYEQFMLNVAFERLVGRFGTKHRNRHTTPASRS